MSAWLIPDDIARCHGTESESVCQRCARREQMGRDNMTRYYPHMHHAPERGRCVYHIEIKEQS